MALVGTTAAELMDSLPEDLEGEIVAVGLVVVVDVQDDDETYTRIKCSSERMFEQLGLFTAALDVVRSGYDPVDDEDSD